MSDAIDDLWRAQEALLQELHLDHEQVRRLGAVRRALLRRRRFLAVELAVELLWVGGLAWLTSRSLGSPALAASALALCGLWLCLMVPPTRELVWLVRLDFDGPLLAVQVALERIRIARLWLARWIVLLAPTIWWVGAAVAVGVITGRDPFDVLPASWWRANVALGLFWLPVAGWLVPALARRFGGGMLARLATAVEGRELGEARALLREFAAARLV